ncbi:multidrug efflux SMR transporter [Campylobacter sp. faydin G-140]|nr:multidrug efflux SMR transporter [Campylobacter anatolicus]
MGYLFLGLAIVFELAGTNFLKLSDGFTKLNYSFATLLAYGFCFYFLALSLKSIKLSIAYATWGGLGIILATMLSFFIFHEKVSIITLLGIALIVIGVVICNFLVQDIKFIRTKFESINRTSTLW